MGKAYPYYFIKFIIREIKFGNYDADDFLERDFDRWVEKFKRENKLSIIKKAKRNIQKFNFSALGQFILKAIKTWKEKD